MLRFLRRLILRRILREMDLLDTAIMSGRARLLVHQEILSYASWESGITALRAAWCVFHGRSADDVLLGLERAAEETLRRERGIELHERTRAR